MGNRDQGAAAGGGIKRFSVIAIAGILLLAVLAGSLSAIGCFKEEAQEPVNKKTDSNKTETVNVDEDVSAGIAGTFVKGTDKIAFTSDGKFILAGPTGAKDGTYKVSRSADGTYKVTLTYPEGVTQDWSVMIGDGKVAAVVNPDGEQWTKS